MIKVSQKRPFLHCSVPAEIPPKNFSVPAEIPPKSLPSRPRYLLSFLLYCIFPDNTGVLNCNSMTKHLVLTQSKPPFIPQDP